MKENLRKMYKKLTLFIGLLAVSFAARSDIQFAAETQREKLAIVAQGILNTYAQRARSAVTIAITQIPNTNTFVVGASTQDVAVCARNSTLVKELLTAQGFAETFASEEMGVMFVSGSGFGVELTTVGAEERIEVVAKTPTKQAPNRDSRGIRYPLHVHAEMSVLQALAVNFQSNSTPASIQEYVIAADKPYCPRCAAYLKNVGVYMPEGTAHIQTSFTNNWCPPNFTNTTSPWYDWLHNATHQYQLNAYTENSPIPIVDGNGSNIVIDGHSALPEARDLAFDTINYMDCENDEDDPDYDPETDPDAGSDDDSDEDFDDPMLPDDGQ